ncbi:MAG TPA: hypothetical protein VF044_00270 [Actinomycetota bacterium]
MATWLLVWLLVAIVSTLAVLAVLVALVRHVLVVGRAAREMQEAVGPLADGIAREGQRASTRAATLQPPGGRRSSGRR